MASQEAKVALVTGSSSGIGEATVKLLASKGYNVVVCGSKQEKVDRAAEECEKCSPTKAKPLKLILDFNNPDNGELSVKKTLDHFGRLDVLVNNAGIFVKSSGNDVNSYQCYRETMAINTDATVKATLAAVEALKKTKGSIVFVSSVASIKPSERGYAYCMSKASMSIFAKCLAIDLAPDIRVNIVSPGPVLTPIFNRIGIDVSAVNDLMASSTLQNRVGRTEEIASTIHFLISHEASFITGHEMFVDGGYLIKPSSHSASQIIINRKQ